MCQESDQIRMINIQAENYLLDQVESFKYISGIIS